VEFPPISDLVEWPGFFNKIALIYLLSALVPIVVFAVAMRQRDLVPRGTRTMAEATIGFVDRMIIMPTMGADGLRYMPFLLSLFLFIAISNFFEVVPVIQMPANGRMAGPLVFALIVYFTWIYIGLRHNGPGFIKSLLFPPGVPKALYILVTPIELISTFFIRPFSHAVRLFANMLAGHILLVTFQLISVALWVLSPLILVQIGSFPMLLALTVFEIGVSLLQAFVFTILTGVYIGGSLHPHH
jgi:F-type H+-transporting ATPase subunit a